MSEYDRKKGTNYKQILHIVKMASLIFSAVAFFQYYFKDKEFYHLLANDGAGFSVVFFGVLIIFWLFYMFWNFLQNKVGHYTLVNNWILPLIFFFIASLVIILTGSYESNYKFLLLFVIISSTIENGTKIGLSVAAAASIFILTIDLMFAPSTGLVNTHFESDIVLAAAFIIIAWTIGFYVKTEKDHIQDLKGLVNIDGLTGLYNHRFFYDSIEEMFTDLKRSTQKENLSLLFMDLDFFKNYNDINGHQLGDEVLKTVSDLIRDHIPEDAIPSRYGGEEFAVILPNTSGKDALEIGEIIRKAVEEHPFPGQEYLPNANLTISVGVSVYPDNAKTEIELVKYADEALYRAKFLSKNSVQPYYSVLDELQKDIKDENDLELIASIKTLIAVINAKDKYTYKHIERVVAYCTIMADKLNMSPQDKKVFIYAAYMHDIGKINIPEDILIKSTPLTEDEWDILKSHSKRGAEIIKNVSVLQEVVPIIMQHHERYDGTGYPMHLRGEQITYLARLLTIVDSYDAMTSIRPYQRTKTPGEALSEIIRCSGTQFDPKLASIFVEMIRETNRKLA